RRSTRSDKLRRTVSSPDRLEDVLRRRQPDRVAHAQRRLPFPGGRMQHEAALPLDRDADRDTRVAQLAFLQLQGKALEERLQRHVYRAVDDGPERALVAVLADI